MIALLGPAVAVAAFMAGCAGTPAAPAAVSTPTPSPSASPSAGALVLPSRSPAAFGAIESITPKIERAITFQRGIDPSRKVYGTGQAYHVVVGGQTYVIHFQYAKNVEKLQVGDTVNLHPSGWYTCVEEAPGGTPSCRELYKIFKGSREQAPINGL